MPVHLESKRILCDLEWIKRKRWPKAASNPGRTLAIADLFCGCGGLTLGAWEAARVHGRRLDIKLAVDNSQEALHVYRKNFGVNEDVAIDEDIRDLFSDVTGVRANATERRLMRRLGHVDLIIAGPPCQGHSDLNNSTRRHDPRNGLYFRVVRAVELLRPKAVVIENVPAVVHDRSGLVERSLAALESFGYGTSTLVVNAANLGLPQRRKRHLLVAVQGNQCIDFSCMQKNGTEPPPLSVYLEGLEDEPGTKSGIFYAPSRMTAENKARVEYLFQNGLHDLPNEYRPSCHRDKEHSYVSMYGRLHWDRPAQTLTSGFGSMGQGRYVHPARPRTLTPHEAARIQGFPDFFDFSGVRMLTALREMIANAVPPRVLAYLISVIFISDCQKGTTYGREKN